MDYVDENTSMNDLQQWKVKQLKYFSRKRGLKVVKRCKDKLVAIFMPNTEVYTCTIQRVKIKLGALDETFNLPLQNKLI